MGAIAMGMRNFLYFQRGTPLENKRRFVFQSGIVRKRAWRGSRNATLSRARAGIGNGLWDTELMKMAQELIRLHGGRRQNTSSCTGGQHQQIDGGGFALALSVVTAVPLGEILNLGGDAGRLWTFRNGLPQIDR